MEELDLCDPNQINSANAGSPFFSALPQNVDIKASVTFIFKTFPKINVTDDDVYMT